MNENALSALWVLYTANNPLTTSDVAKRVFDPEDDTEMRNADRKVRHYLKKSYPHLIDEVDDTEPQRFDVLDELVYFGVGKMHMVTDRSEEVILGMGDVLVYQDADGDQQVVRLTFGEVGDENAPSID